MDDKYIQILMILLDQDYVPTQELSITLRKTNRTIRTYIKELNDILNMHGARLTMVYNKGHHLEILDEECFTSWLSMLQLSSVDYNNQDDRVMEILTHLFFIQEYMKQEDMMDILYISLKQLKEDLKIVKKILNQFHLKLETKPYLGMKIEGQESDMRSCIVYIYYQYSSSFLKDNIAHFDMLVQSIQNIVFSCIANKSYQISDDNLNQLVHYIIIAITRYQSHHEYHSQDDHIDQHSIPYQIALNIASMILKILDISLNHEEIEYIAIGLLSKENKVLENNQSISQQMEELIMEMIGRIKDYYGISFINEFDLLISLSLHVEPLISRIRYRSFIHNPLTKEIKTSLCQSYEMATIACEVLNEKYHVILPEDEIAMVALHIDLAYEKNIAHIQKKNILIVCSSGIGTARFIKARFQKQFGDFLNQVDVPSALDIKSYQLSQYDCIFTTIDLTLPINKPIIKIDNMMNDQDVHKIENHLQNQIHLQKYIKQDLFLHKLECQNKNDCLHQMIQHMQKHYSLPLEFEELVFKREEIGSTEFGNVIALPHPLYPVCKESLLSVAILKKSIVWNDHRIRIVILMSVSNSQDIMEIDEVYHIISTILSHKVLQSQLIRSSSYEEVIENIRSYL